MIVSIMFFCFYAEESVVNSVYIETNQFTKKINKYEQDHSIINIAINFTIIDQVFL